MVRSVRPRVSPGTLLKLKAICEYFGLSSHSEALDQAVISYSHDLARRDSRYLEIFQRVCETKDHVGGEDGN